MLVPHPKAWSPNLALAWCPLWRASACARLPAAAEMAGLPCVLIVYRRGSRETHYGPKLLIHLIKSILVLNCAARTKIFILLRSCEGIARGRAGREPTGGRSKAVGQNGLGRRPG